MFVIFVQIHKSVFSQLSTLWTFLSIKVVKPERKIRTYIRVYMEYLRSLRCVQINLINCCLRFLS